MLAGDVGNVGMSGALKCHRCPAKMENEMALDITQAKEELKKVLGREKAPTRGEMTSYLLGFSRGLLVQMGQGVAGEEITSREAGVRVKCPHCGKDTPRDAARCIHCHRNIK